MTRQYLYDDDGRPVAEVVGRDGDGRPDMIEMPARCTRCGEEARTHVHTRHFGKEAMCWGCACEVLNDAQTEGTDQEQRQ